jgi:hypothetical protein
MIGEEHDILVHAILVRQIHHCRWVGLGEEAEEGDVQSAAAGVLIAHLFLSASESTGTSRGKMTYDWRQLEVVAHEDKRLGHPKRSEAGRQRDLRRLVDDAVVELAAKKEGAA